MDEQLRLLIEVATVQKAILADVVEIKGTIAKVVANQDVEVAGCPFHPARKTNGEKALSRIDCLEDRLEENSSYLKGLLVGLGGLGAIQIGPGVWDLIRRVLVGG